MTKSSKSPQDDSPEFDTFLYVGDISREGYEKLTTELDAKLEKKDQVCFAIVTLGGDPDAAFRIARALQHHYENIKILIPDLCKSAGTIVAIGGNEIIIGDRGELGPLDIQISKPDEMFERMSGLDIIQALTSLETLAISSFRQYLLDIRGGSRIRTKTAADIAVKLVESFIAPMASKIDPITIGEHERAIKIALEYGKRLNAKPRNLRPGALEDLVTNYPCHGFVIDRKEARGLFNKVSSPSGHTEILYSYVREDLLPKIPSSGVFVLDIDLGGVILEKSKPTKENHGEQDSDPVDE